MQCGEMNLGREKSVVDREPPLQVGKGQRLGGGGIQEKHPSPKAAGEKVESWKQPQGLNLKGRKEKGERRGFKFHEDCKRREHKGCNSAARHLAVLWWEGQIPRNRVGPGGSRATWRKAVPLLEGHLVETIEATWSQQTSEGGHIRWCWGKVTKGEVWCQMCVVTFHNP